MMSFPNMSSSSLIQTMQQQHQHQHLMRKPMMISHRKLFLQSRVAPATVLVDLDNIAYSNTSSVFDAKCLTSRLNAIFVALPPQRNRYSMYCNRYTSKFMHEHGFGDLMHLVDVAHTSDKDAADHALIAQYLMLIDNKLRQKAEQRVTIVTADKNLARMAYYFHRKPAQLQFATFKAGSCTKLDVHRMERFPLMFNDKNDFDAFIGALTRFYKYQSMDVKTLY